jgi:chromosome segregation ATPase
VRYAEREVKRANRDLSSLLSTIESPLSRLEIVQKKYTDLLADLRRLEREHAKSKKRAEQLQKERDAGRTELSKMVAMKEKMEKLSRELQKEKQKLKVSLMLYGQSPFGFQAQFVC